MSEYYDERDDLDDPIEGYCMRCRESVMMEEPQPVWTRRGLPATRGECPTCGGTVFRMGKTPAHNAEQRPDAVQVAPGSGRVKLAMDTAYIAFSENDAIVAEQLAEDLQKAGIATWLHEPTQANVHWASGVHPALQECSRMVVILSTDSVGDAGVQAAWTFFKQKGKRIVIAQVAPIDPPDLIRRSARFDFSGDYRTSFRQMVGALSQ
jgi:hypothetical protein